MRPEFLLSSASEVIILLAALSPSAAFAIPPRSEAPSVAQLSGASKPSAEQANLSAPVAQAEAAGSGVVEEPADEILVIGRSQANTEVYTEEETRAVRGYNALLKRIAGVAANDFDQGGVGFGLTLRGFTERSNGGNVALFIDGVPVNQPGHRSANGNGDLSSLIPELIGSFTLVRGPFDVRAGPFALAGSGRYETRDEPSSGASVKGGSHRYGRGFAVVDFSQGQVRGYGSLMLSTTQGYRDNAEWKQLNSFNKILFPLLGGTASIRAQIYESDFESPGFINRDRIKAGTLDRKTARNSSDGGDTSLRNLVLKYRTGSDVSPLTVSAYVIDSNHNRYSSRGNTLPVLPTVAGIQFLTQDDRVTYGGSIEKQFRLGLSNGMRVDLLAGAGVRWDDVESNEFRSTNRNIVGQSTAVGTLVNFNIANSFAYLQANVTLAPWLLVRAGARYDDMNYDIRDRTNPASIRRVRPTLEAWQPTVGVSLTPLPGVELFANYGRGFRPPSPIGNAQFLFNPEFPEAIIKSREFGVVYGTSDNAWRVRASYYHTSFTDEIFGQPPPLTSILLGPSIRNGYDIEAEGIVYRSNTLRLSGYASYSSVDGRLKSPPVRQGSVLPEVADYFVKYGIDLDLRDGKRTLTASLGQVWEGPKALDTFGIFKTKAFSRIDASLTYSDKRWHGISVIANAVIYPDRRLEETAFVFANQVGVSAKPPVTFTVGTFVPF